PCVNSSHFSAVATPTGSACLRSPCSNCGDATTAWHWSPEGAEEVAPILLALAGLGLSVVFILGVALPLNMGVIALSGATIWGLLTLRLTAHSLLSRLAILLYSVPLSVILFYL